MTKALFFILCLFSLMACKNEVSHQANEQNPEVVQANAQPVALPSSNKVKRDTIIPKTPRQSNIIIDQARPKSKINGVFPYDIDLKNIKGEVAKSSEIISDTDKPTVLLFWLTTCYPCRMELDAIKKVYKDWTSETDFNMVVISTDFQKNYQNFVDRVKEENWDWTTYHDTRREFRHVMPGGLNGLPQVFVIDSKGEIVYHKRRYYTGDEHKLYEAVKKAS